MVGILIALFIPKEGYWVCILFFTLLKVASRDTFDERVTFSACVFYYWLNVRESNSWYKIHVSNQSSWVEASMMTIKFLIQLFYLIMLVGLLLALFYLERVILKKGFTDFRLEWMWNWILIDCLFYLLLMGRLHCWCIICLDGANNFLLKSNGLLWSFVHTIGLILSQFLC